MCRKWTKSEPEDAYAWYELGSAYGKLKRYDDAIGAYHQAIRIDPEDAYAWNLLGVYYALSGNRTAALEAVQELRRLDPAQADKLFHLIDPSVPR
jgi:tetratricopeptide (TPR) repeat protein